MTCATMISTMPPVDMLSMPKEIPGSPSTPVVALDARYYYAVTMGDTAFLALDVTAEKWRAFFDEY